MKKKERSSFLLYYGWRQYFEELSGEQIKQLVIALYDFSQYGEIAEFPNDMILRIAFRQMSEQLARDNEKYLDRCEKNAISARKRWNKEHGRDVNDGVEEKPPEIPLMMQTYANASNCINRDAKNADIDIDIDTEDDFDLEKEIEIDRDYPDNANAANQIPTRDQVLAELKSFYALDSDDAQITADGFFYYNNRFYHWKGLEDFSWKQLLATYMSTKDLSYTETEPEEILPFS